MSNPEAVPENLGSPDEMARLQALKQYQVLDTLPDPALDDLTRLAAEICQTPIALISLVDRDRQWFKSKVGIDVLETPRSIAFCAYTIQQKDIFIVPDALLDERFFDNPLVTHYPRVRFYAGVSLQTADGFAIGTLCVIDHQQRQLSEHQINALQTLARQVMAQLDLKWNTQRLEVIKTDYQNLQQQFTEQEILSQQESILFNLAGQIRNSLDLDTILNTAVHAIRNLFQTDYCYFLWCLPSENAFSLTISHEAKLPELNTLVNSLVNEYGISLASTIARQEILPIHDLDAMPHLDTDTYELLLRQGVRSQLLIPLKTYSGQLGAIVCSHRHTAHVWSAREIKLLRGIADHLAIALDQAELFAQTRSTALAAQAQAQYLAEALQKLQQTQAQLVQHEKMSSLGQLVAGVAHEINNPVNFISGNITYASDYIHDLLELLNLYQEHYPDPHPLIQDRSREIDLDFITEDLQNLLSSMKMGAERISQIVLSLRNFSRLDQAEMKPVNIHEGIENTLLILRSRLIANSKGCAIQILKEYENLPPVECYAGQLNQVFMNLLSNAIDALDEATENPTITIHTEVTFCPLDDDVLSQTVTSKVACVPQVVIRIRDNGSGMLDSVRQQIFNPFFTTKPVGKGTGLGLSISYQIITEKHHGSLTCSSEIGQGSEFVIQIPVKSQDYKG